MERRDWIVLVLGAAKDATLEPVQLQKSLFIIGEKLKLRERGDFYSFEPYNFGPFTAQIYFDADRLAEDGLVSRLAAPGGRWYYYGLTPAGQATVGALRAKLDAKIGDYVQRVVEWAEKLSFQEIVRAVYTHFPETRANSIFRD